MTAGVLILVNAVLLGVAATRFPEIILTLPGSADNSAAPFNVLTTVGVICGILILLGALMLRIKPANGKVWSIIMGCPRYPAWLWGEDS